MSNREACAEDAYVDEASPEAAAAKVRGMADSELLYCYDRLHHPSLLEAKWISLLEADIKRRGLRSTS